MAYETKEWRVVPGFHFLEASSDGELRTKNRIVMQTIHGKMTPRFCPGKLLKPQPTPKGRMIVTVKGKAMQVSRLVCSAFHGLPPDGKPWALHGDDDPTNNRPNNLRWGTPEENTAECIAKGRGFVEQMNGMFKHGKHSKAAA